jgi:hypothetical protein
MDGLRVDNSIQSANLPTQDSLAQNQANKDYNMYRCMVSRTRYVDDGTNFTSGAQNPQVLYECIIIGGPKEGQILTNVRAGTNLGGKYNFEELVYHAASKSFFGDQSLPLSQQDGDIVFVMFMNGNLTSPTIIASGNHVTGMANQGAKKSDGPRFLRELNGVRTEITKDGDYNWTKKDGAYDSGTDQFVPTNAPKISVQVKGEKITIVTAGGLSITVDGDSDSTEIQTAGGLKLTLDGAGDVATLKTSGGGTLKISKDKVALGNSSLEVVDALSQTLNLLSTDLGNLGLPLVNAPQYASLKSQVDAIKGSV